MPAVPRSNRTGAGSSLKSSQPVGSPAKSQCLQDGVLPGVAPVFFDAPFSSASFLGRLELAFITTSCSIFFRIPTSRLFFNFCCCTTRAFLGAMTRPPFRGPRLRSAAAALLLGFCAWNLRCPCAMFHRKPEEAGQREPEVAGRHWLEWDAKAQGFTNTERYTLRTAVQKVGTKIMLTFSGVKSYLVL